MNRAIAPIVARLTSQYIENLDAEKLQISVMSGVIELSDLTLKRSALAELDLPVDVVKGTLSKLTIVVPWTSLSKKAVEVKVDKLLLLAKPKTFGRQVSYVRFVPVRSRSGKTDTCHVGGIELLGEKDALLELTGISTTGPLSADYSHFLDKSQWKSGMTWKGGSKEALVLQTKRLCCLKGFRMKTGLNSADVDGVEWKVEGAMASDGPWHELHHLKEGAPSIPKGRQEWSEIVRIKASLKAQRNEILKNKQSSLVKTDELLKGAEDLKGKEASFVERLQETIINNLQIEIKTTHIRFEDDMINPDHVYAAGVCLDSLTLYSTNEDWEKAFVQQVGDTLHKKAELRNFGVYMDHVDHLTHDLPLRKWQEEMVSMLGKKHTYILAPLTMNAKLAMLSMKGKKKDLNVPNVAMDVESQELALGINRPQVVSVLEVLAFTQKYSLLDKYQQVRPNYPVKVKPRGWWHFALRCVVKTLREQRKPSEQAYRGKKKVAKEYKENVKKLAKLPWLTALKPEKLAKLKKVQDAYEYHLPLSVLEGYRTDVFKEMRQGWVLYEAEQKKHAEKLAEKKKAQSWGSWLMGSKVEETDEEMKARQNNLLEIDESARNQLKESIDWDESASPVEVDRTRPEVIQTKLCLKVNKTLVSLSEKRKSTFGTLVLSGVDFDVKMRANGLATALALQDFYIEDTATEQKIVSVRETGGKNLLDLSYQQPALNKLADAAFELDGKGLSVIFNGRWLARVLALVQVPPQINLSSLEAATAVALADLGSGATSSVLMALEDTKSLDINVNMAGPLLIVPYGTHGGTLQVNSGVLCITSNADNTRVQRLQKGEAKDQDYYERYNLGLEGMSVSLVDGVDKSKSQHLMSDVKLQLTADRCLVPDDVDHPSMKLGGTLSDVNLYVSPHSVDHILESVDTIMDFVQNPTGVNTEVDWSAPVKVKPPKYIDRSERGIKGKGKGGGKGKGKGRREGAPGTGNRGGWRRWGKEGDDETWQVYNASFNKAASRLTLAREDEDPIVVWIGPLTEVERKEADSKVSITLPQKALSPTAIIRLVVKTDEENSAEELKDVLAHAVWFQKEWVKNRDKNKAMLTQQQAARTEEKKEKESKDKAGAHVPATKVEMQCKLVLDGLGLMLVDEKNANVTSVQIKSISLGCEARQHDTSVDLSVGKFFVADDLRSPDDKNAPRELLCLSGRDREGARIGYSMGTEGSPLEFVANGIGSMLKVSTGQFVTDIERDTLPHMLGYLMKYSKIGQDKEEKVVFQESAPKEEKASNTGGGGMVVEIDMDEFVTRFRNLSDEKFSTSAKKSRVQLSLNEEEMKVVACLGDFGLKDHSKDNTVYQDLVSSGSSGSTLNVEFSQKNNPPSSSEPEYTAVCKVELGASKIVYLQRTVAQFVRYFDVGYIMKEIEVSTDEVAAKANEAAKVAASMAAKAAAQRNQSFSLMQLDLMIDKPTVICPYSIDSVKHAELVLGRLLLKTSLDNKGDTGRWLELMNIVLEDTSFSLNDPDMGKDTNVIHNWSITALGERMVIDPSHELPLMKVTSKIGGIQVELTKMQYEALFRILNSNVADQWIDQQISIVSPETAVGAADEEEKENELSGDESEAAPEGTAPESEKHVDPTAAPHPNVPNFEFEMDVSSIEFKLVDSDDLLLSFMKGVRVSFLDQGEEGQISKVWLDSIGVLDERPTASQHCKEFFVFGNAADEPSSPAGRPLVESVNSKEKDELKVNVPPASFTVIPQLVGAVMGFFVSTEYKGMRSERNARLKSLVEGKADHFVTNSAYEKLDADLFLGPTHRLIVRGSHEHEQQASRVVIDGQGKYNVYLTGMCNCIDKTLPLDVQESCIVVAADTTLVFLNTRIFCVYDLAAYILPGSGTVLVDEATSAVKCKTTSAVAKSKSKGDAGKNFAVNLALKTMKVRLPEDCYNPHSRMLIAVVEGTVQAELGRDGSQLFVVQLQNITVFPTHLSGSEETGSLQIHNVLGPARVQFNSQLTQPDVSIAKGGIADRVTSIAGENCGVRISYTDIKTGLGLWTHLSAAIFSDQAPVEDALVIYAPSYENPVLAAGVADSEPKATEDVSHDVEGKMPFKGKTTVRLDTFSVLIVDDKQGFDRELLSLALQADEENKSYYALDLVLTDNMDADGAYELGGQLDVIIALDYLSQTNANWEPILEPYSCSLTLSQVPNPKSASVPLTSFKLHAPFRPLNLNLSSESISSLITVSNEWSAGLVATDSTSSHNLGNVFAHRYVCINQTGLVLTMKGAFTTASQSFDEHGCVQLGSKPVSFNLVNDAGSAVQAVDIDFDQSGLRPIKLVESAAYQIFEVPSTQHERLVYVTIRKQQGQLVITLSSRFLVFNRTMHPLEFKVENTVVKIPAYNYDSIFETNDGLSEVGVPLWAFATKACFITLRSAHEKHAGYHWSTCGGSPGLQINHSLPENGSLMCGYVGSDGPKEPLAFAFSRTVRETPSVGLGASLNVLEIRAPLFLENLLPCPLEISLSHGQSMADTREKISLQPGESTEVFGLSLDGSIWATFFVMTPESGQNFRVSQPICIHSDSLVENIEKPLVKVKDHVNNRDCSFIIDNKCCGTQRALREVSIYAPYWLVNLSNHALLYVRDKDNKLISNGLHNMKEAGTGIAPALLFSGIDDDPFGSLITIGIAPSQQSTKFSHDIVGVPGEVRVKDDKGYERRLGVTIELGPKRFMRTKMVKVTERFVFKNETNEDLVLKRSLKGAVSEMRLGAGKEDSNVYFPVSTEKKGKDQPEIAEGEVMRLALASDSVWQDSTPVTFSVLGTVFITMIQETGYKLKVFECNVVQLGSVNYVIISAADAPPLRVINNTFHTITVGDRKAGYPEIQAQPFSIRPYYAERQGSEKVPSIRVRAEGVIDASMELVLGPQEQKGTGDVIAYIERGLKCMLLVLEHEGRRKLSSDMLQVPSLKVDIATSLGISMIQGEKLGREELAYLFIDDLNLDFKQKSGNTLDLTVRVRKIQMDNMLSNAIFPVILRSHGGGSMQSQRDKDKEKTLEVLDFRLRDYSTRIGGMTFFDEMYLLLQEVFIMVDDTFLFKLLEYLSTVFVVKEKVKEDLKESIEFVPAYKAELHSGEKDGKFYATALVFNPLKFTITFQAEQDQKSTSNVMQTLLKTLTLAVTNIDNGVLKLAALIMRPVNGTFADVLSVITNHYINSAIRGAYGLIGALDFIGNPVGLFGNLGDGISDLFYEPIHGITQSPKDFVTGIGKGISSMGRHSAYGLLSSVGGLTTSVSKGVAALSLDDSYLKERRRQQREKAHTFAQGLEQGFGALGRGLRDGVTGIVTKPKEGYDKHDNKVLGLTKGVALGLVGIPVKIASGALDAVGKCAEGAKGQVSGSEAVRRKRMQRALVGGVVQPYDHINAIAKDMVAKLGFSDVIALLKQCAVGRDDFLYSVFTSDHLVIFNVKKGKDNETWTTQQVVDYLKIKEIVFDNERTVSFQVVGSGTVKVLLDVNTERRDANVREIADFLQRVLPRVPMHGFFLNSAGGHYEVWENERRYTMLTNWTKTLLPKGDRPAWSDADGKEKRQKTDYENPPQGCVWEDEWHVDKNKETDEQGWMYSKDFSFAAHTRASRTDMVRRRRWMRKYKRAETAKKNAVDEIRARRDDSGAIKGEPTKEIKEFDVYENQRSYPFVGFSSKLMPTDRASWSDKAGKNKIEKKDVSLPSGWIWLGDWQLERSSKADKDGWMYAVDFPMEYHPSTSLTRSVRRRRWIRCATKAE
ncbi:Vacuolar protein sorting-associated protein 13a [Diplonema papillatum]|nr:Vacuolar protein sorting-associated protein 13a [Diplonema papillatum]